VCVVLHLPDGTIVERRSELEAVVGSEVKWLPGYDVPAGYDTCLCPLDLDHCAWVNGWKLEWRHGEVFAKRRLDA